MRSDDNEKCVFCGRVRFGICGSCPQRPRGLSRESVRRESDEMVIRRRRKATGKAKPK